jgi:hypothetical protein
MLKPMSNLFTRATKPSLARPVRRNGMVKSRSIKIWPKRFAEIQLGVSQLPEQKIAYALLTARPNK